MLGVDRPASDWCIRTSRTNSSKQLVCASNWSQCINVAYPNQANEQTGWTRRTATCNAERVRALARTRGVARRFIKHGNILKAKEKIFEINKNARAFTPTMHVFCAGERMKSMELRCKWRWCGKAHKMFVEPLHAGRAPKQCSPVQPMLFSALMLYKFPRVARWPAWVSTSSDANYSKF